ncbi:hypothetical protein EYF80_065018 [Liparis tanakae]|uniref:Uncharacterized protein n=1 Tax=Liparis tanakae TaxID=230148 RepID=A0A4Z2E7X0_9TELE|nr:hypothetical protein EYF80_065018 [Liparis tanakae]
MGGGGGGSLCGAPLRVWWGGREERCEALEEEPHGPSPFRTAGSSPAELSGCSAAADRLPEAEAAGADGGVSGEAGPAGGAGRPRARGFLHIKVF